MRGWRLNPVNENYLEWEVRAKITSFELGHLNPHAAGLSVEMSYLGFLITYMQL